MIRDATSTRHLPAEPKPGPRWLGLAQEMRRRLFLMTTQTVEVNQVTVRVVAAVAAFIAVAGTLVAVTVWLTNLSHRANAGAMNEAGIVQVQKDLARLEGKVDALTGMSQELSNLGANVGSLTTRLNGQDRKIEEMDVWILTTREMMQDAGLNPAPYRRGQIP